MYVPGTTQAQGASAISPSWAGNGSPFTDERREYFRPRMSPDGARVAVEVTEQGLATHIWIVAVESGVATQLTFGGSRNRFPVWTSDGQTVIFASDRVEGEGPGVYRKAADGSAEATLVVPEDGVVIPTDVSRDGVLAFQKAGEETRDDIWTVELDGAEAPSVFLSTPAEERAARFSPDGRWVAYQTGQGGGDLQVYVRPYPRTEGSQRRISEEAGRAPIWSPDGRSLYFAGLFPVPLHVASIQTTPSFSRGSLEELFVIVDEGFRGSSEIMIGPIRDITPDGERFVMVQPAYTDASETPGVQINVVLNWTQELLERVPID